jgi:hypothetical protein
MFPPVETKDAPAVASFVISRFERMFPGASPIWLTMLFADIQDLFTGRQPDYAAIDLRYHDLEHTLQAAVCISLLLEGRHATPAEPRLSARHFELALSAALLHDTGYLKLRSDHSGTGAKYTYCHVLRSCAFAASYLPSLGADDLDIEMVLNAINCTGPSREASPVHFRDPINRVIGAALGTADFLGQMAARDYPDELEILFQEFQEADEYIHLPASRRAFSSAAELIERTPAFWQEVVKPKLDHDFQGLYRFLARPYPDGANAYLDAVERNLAKISQRTASPTIAAK